MSAPAVDKLGSVKVTPASTVNWKRVEVAKVLWQSEGSAPVFLSGECVVMTSYGTFLYIVDLTKNSKIEKHHVWSFTTILETGWIKPSVLVKVHPVSVFRI